MTDPAHLANVVVRSSAGEAAPSADGTLWRLPLAAAETTRIEIASPVLSNLEALGLGADADCVGLAVTDICIEDGSAAPVAPKQRTAA